MSRMPGILSRLAQVSVLVVLAAGLLGVAFWCTGLRNLEIIDSDYVPIALLASLTYLTLVLPLLTLSIFPRSKMLRLLSAAAVLVLLSIYLLKGLSALTGFGTDIETLIAPNPGEQTGFPANRISPVASTALPFSCASILILLLALEKWRALRSAAIVISGAVALVGAIAVLGYLYGTPLLYGGEVRPVAPLSAIALLFLGLGICASCGPGYWPVDAFLGNSVRARMMRAFLPLTMIMVFLVGVATVRTAEVSNNPVLAASLISIAAAALVALFVYRLSSSVGGQIDRANAVRREAEERLRAANEKLTMLGSITRHDIMNQVTVLKGFASIGEEAKDMDDKTDALRRIASASDSIERMVTFAGVYQEVGLKAPGWIDVRRAFEGGLAGVARFQAKTIVDVDGVEVFADRMLEKVFTNLVDNSRRHGGRVTTISLRYETSGKNLKLVYEDDGEGVPDSEKEEIFLSGFGKHTGMGMYLSREILAITGIGIVETGAFGKGARFELVVPEGKFRLRNL
jgi:signal transduction histidine kinase